MNRMQQSPMTVKKKLIEVALPLEAINKAAREEKAVPRHGHPQTLHFWWARRPLAAARAVIFAQMVDDPSAHPDLFPTEEAQERERQRLFRIIEELVRWENTTNSGMLQRARDEIWLSWRYTCAENASHPNAKELFNPLILPPFHDPFAGGGTLPLEAQRLGLQAYASDLNPVAVLICKAMIEIPPKFANQPPVRPGLQAESRLLAREWRGAQGLAEDVRYYGHWMRDEAEKRIGHLYPKVEVTTEMARERPDLKMYVGKKLKVNVRGEHVYAVEGLAYGSDTLRGERTSTAARLFVQSARRALPGFVLGADDLPALERICERVQGMPLALEMAAAWVELLPLEDIDTEIAHSLDFLQADWHDASERQRSMRAVFEWSWQLWVTPSELSCAGCRSFAAGSPVRRPSR